jgi:hypothetical protein
LIHQWPGPALNGCRHYGSTVPMVVSSDSRVYAFEVHCSKCGSRESVLDLRKCINHGSHEIGVMNDPGECRKWLILSAR